jgi:DNA-binding NarL/FixJ family response regulator
MPGPHVYLCHRNRLLSECLANALSESGDVVCSVLSPELALRTCSSPRDVEGSLALLLLDATLEAGLTDQVAELIRQYYPTCKLLLLVAESAANRMIELAHFKSHGCLCEDVSLADVRGAIQSVLSGHSFCSPQLANALMAQIGRIDHTQNWARHCDAVQLTSREREVLELIAWEHLGNKQIAGRLSVSLYTVKNHVHNIIEKLGVQDRHEAVQFAKRRHLLAGESSKIRDASAIPIPR